MKKTRMPQRLLSLVLVLMMLISVLPVSAMAAELTPSDPETGLTATDVTNELTDSDRLAIFEDNMDSSKVSRSEIPADDEMVKVIVQLDADSLLDVRNRTNASMSMLDFQQTDAAKAQLKDIANLQLSVMNTMESKGIPSSFTFSYTSVVSGFAAQVPYGRINDIKNIDGVEDVVLCQTYYTDSMGSATLGQALTAAEVAAYSNNTQYQGEGMLIGILDTGLDVNHEAFANAPAVQKLQKSSLSKLLYQISQGEDGKTNITAYSYAALWYAQKHSSSSLVLLTEDDLYKSGKVPFAFDYADADADVIPSADAVEKYGNDHGTHVAGITAGKTVDADGSVTFAGQSPEAQLAIFKVFSDSTNGASTDTILAALNDALLLDVDVINMSLGSNGGFGREAEGVDHLYIQVADYAGNTATYKINLNKEELSGPVSVTLDKQSIKMYKGGTAALNAEVSPFGVKPDGVTWKSSDETVATVNERGIITGVNKGTATITAASIKDPTATASCVVTVQTVDTTLVGALMDTNGDAQFYTWDMEHDTTWKKLVNFETTKSVSASTFDARTGDVYLQDGSFNINKMDLDTGKTLATYPGFEGEIPMWDMEYSLVYSTEAKPMLASVYATYFMSPKPVDNLDLSAFDLGLYLWLFADASYFTAVTSLGANKIDTDKDGVKDTDTELFLALDDAGNIWTMNVYPSVDKETGKDTWGASFGIIESNLANVGYAANPTDDGDLYDSLYATVEGQELVLYLANFTGDASHVYRILLNEDTGKWEAADIGNFGDGVWPATLVGTMYHANEDAAKAVNAAMSKTTVHTAQAVEMTPAQIQRYNGAETQAAKGSLNTAAPVAALVNLPMGDAAENATASNVTVSADEKTVTVNVLAKDAATNGLFTVDYDAANLTLTNVAFNTQYSSYKDASGKVTLGYVDLNGVTAGSTVATLTFAVKDPTALDKINVTVTETERNDQTVNNAETLTADLHTETETVNAKAATCTEDGYTGDVVCKACGKVITKGEVIPATGHDTEIVGAKEPTCTEDGYTGDEVCKTCGVTVKKGEVIPALGHKIKLVGAKEPTCTEDGYTGDEVCTICGEIVKKGEVIKATGHQYKDGKCTVCGAADPNYKPSVKTGDESNTALWVLVMASAALLAAAVVVLPRKKHSR